MNSVICIQAENQKKFKSPFWFHLFDIMFNLSVADTNSPIFRDVNNSIMELLIMAYACKTSSCNNVIGVIPYLPYSQQSKSSGDACATKLVASLHRIDNTFRMSAPGFHVKDGCFGRTVTCVDTGTFLHFPTSSIAILFCRDCNNIVMEMLIMAYACKTSTARRVIGVIPYMPYSQQCKSSETPAKHAPANKLALLIHFELMLLSLVHTN